MSNSKLERFCIIPIILAAAVVPLIVLLRIVNLDGMAQLFWTGGSVNYDIFSYYKMAGILITALAGVLTLAAVLKNKGVAGIKQTRLYLPMGIYALFVLLSAVFSNYKGIALYGFTERYEGFFTLMAYILLLFVTVNVVNEERHVRLFFRCLFISAFLVCVVGVFQYASLDLLNISFIKNLVELPAGLQGDTSKLNFQLSMPNMIYSTMYNYNYVGSYVAMLLPISVAMYIILENRYKKILMGSLSVLIYFNLVGCNSRAGLIGAIFALLLVLAMLRRKLAVNMLYLTGLLICFVLVTYTMSHIRPSLNTLQRAVASIPSEMALSGTTGDLEDVVAGENDVLITAGGNKLFITSDNGGLAFKDEKNKELEVAYDEKGGKYALKDKRYSSYRLELKENVLKVTYNGYILYFAVTNKGFKAIDIKGHILSMEQVEKWGFEGKEFWASSRGYIWSRSIPMLKNTVFLGTGPDTFALYFPQYDWLGKLKYLWDSGMLVDKPHNFYLQVALNTGIISLLALLVLFAAYAVQSLRLFLRAQFKDTYEAAGLCVFVAIAGYLITALFNDSVVSVAPVFWVLLGVGISINHMLIGKRKLTLIPQPLLPEH